MLGKQPGDRAGRGQIKRDAFWNWDMPSAGGGGQTGDVTDTQNLSMDRSPVRQFLTMITSVCKLKRQPPPSPLLIQIKTNPRTQPVTVTATALSVAWERKASAIGGLGSSVHGGAGGFAEHYPTLLSEAGVLEVPA